LGINKSPSEFDLTKCKITSLNFEGDFWPEASINPPPNLTLPKSKSEVFETERVPP
jgi:hypothetical protein